VHHLDGGFAPGSLTAVVGPNGGGKSTLLRAIAGALPPTEGRIERGALRARDIAYLPQQAAIDRSFPIATLDAVMLGDWARSGVFGGLDGGARARAAAALAAVGLGGFGARPIATLSAGQFQRALFARMLLQDARLILLDEPFAAIDARTTADLLGVVRRWHDEARTVIAVLHDLDQVRAHFPETLLLAREAIAWGPTAAVLTAANQLRARAMAEAWAPDAAPCRRDAA
jgi:zinc/manganese transport system ATP-binding protein